MASPSTPPSATMAPNSSALETNPMIPRTALTQLAKLVAKAKEIVGGTSAPTLRSSDEFREKVRSGMAAVKEQLAGLVEEKGRKFRLDED